MLAEGGLDRSALRGDRPVLTVSLAGGHVNRIVLDRFPTQPSASDLAAFPKLEVLHLIASVSTLDVLPEACGLTELRLASNGLGDLAPLSRCRDLERLWIVDEGVRSLGSVPPLANLKALYVDRTPLSSLSGVGDRPALETLLINGAGLASLEGLDGLPKLRTLDLSKNQLSDAAVLDRLGALEDVNLADNELETFPAVALRAEIPKISGNPGADKVRKADYDNHIATLKAQAKAERELQFSDSLPPVNGRTQKASKSVSWSGRKVEGKGSIGTLEGMTMVQLRQFSPTDVHSSSKRPEEHRFEFTVGSGKARVYFDREPGPVPYIDVEPGTPRVVRTSMVAGDRWVGFFVEAVDGPVSNLRYTIGP